jgi:hypothetical protein
MATDAETGPVESDRVERVEPERIELDPVGWDDRQLCPDGACIGVIGADGRCTVCGTVDPTWSPDRPRAAPAPVEVAPEPGEAPAATGEVPEWDDRQLCPDGACIGVIGSDGRCTVCGTAAAPSA